MQTCILFFHHCDDSITRDHLRRLRLANPDADVVPLWCDDGRPARPLEGATQVACTWECGSNWHNADLVWRQWFLDHGQRHRADRYIWVEYDTLCLAPFSDCYADVWDADAAACDVRTEATHPDHWWIRTHADFVPRDWRPHVTTTVPFNGIMLSHQALAAFAHEPARESLFCELRMATCLRAMGFNIVQLPPERATMNQYLPPGQCITVTGPGIWHPVKRHPFDTVAAPARRLPLHTPRTFARRVAGRVARRTLAAVGGTSRRSD